jgi:DNA-binding transcriptional MerR regulator
MISDTAEIKKTYYSISEVCIQTGLEPHVLRYWETEFPQLRPKKNRAGNRAYRDKDIDIVRFIKHLLYEEQYTIPGAKKKLLDVRDVDEINLDSSISPAQTSERDSGSAAVRKQCVSELREVLKILRL